jgi:hypothetical protein
MEANQKLIKYNRTDKCVQCGQELKFHVPVNHSDGQMVMKTVDICPTVLFKPKFEKVEDD